MLGADPLKIYYLVVLQTDDPQEVTAFQGFSTSWRYVHWALHLIATLPADVLEKSYELSDVIAQRMGGHRSIFWLPVNIKSLELLSSDQIGPFIACFSGEEEVALRVRAWIEAQPNPILHVSMIETPGAYHAAEFNHEKLRRYCLEAFEVHIESLTPDRQAAARKSLDSWSDPMPIPVEIKEMLHNVLLPNHMSLKRAARSLKKGGPFIGRSEREYTAAILESAQEVFRVRDEVGLRPLHAMTLLAPAIILAEPALLRHAYKRIRPRSHFEDRSVTKTLRVLQRQRGLHTQTNLEYLNELQRSRAAQMVIMERQSELETLTLGAGLKAAQTCSAVIRLSPGVNHVFSDLSAYARHVRSERIEARLKTPRLFGAIQKRLKEAVGDERIAFVEQNGGPIKILADAPMEWLPIGNLPLSLRYDCSRINATPGNLMMGLLTNMEPLTFLPVHLQKILVVSSFAENDPLRHALTASLRAIQHQWEDKVEVVFASVSKQEEFISVLNNFDGFIMIFDGHGADNSAEPVGKIVFGKEGVDVWQMRGDVRIPPIVILSACDTHGIDASSHATVGNGFLALGARTVLATLLPVGGIASASFVARLVYRIADFLPAALAARQRVLSWTEIIAGMLRMLYASEVLDGLVGPPAPIESPRGKMQSAANLDINTGEENWYDNLLDRIAELRGDPRERVDLEAKAVLARCQAIRYIQLGNPESLLIDDGTIRDRVMQEYSGALS